MQKVIIVTLLLISAIVVNAQEWQTDLEKSKAIAKEKNRNIILVFSGSDWCAPCMKLENEILSSEEFKTYAKDHFVLLRADFPEKKKNRLSDEQQKKNNMLAEKYNLHGYFPFVVVLDFKGNILGTTGYKKVSSEEYIKILTSFKAI